VSSEKSWCRGVLSRLTLQPRYRICITEVATEMPALPMSGHTSWKWSEPYCCSMLSRKGTTMMDKLRVAAVAAILLLMAFIALTPTVTYAPVPRLVLFTLASSAIAIFLGAEASTKLELRFPGFALITAGTAALAFGLLWYLNSTLKPDLQVAIYQVQDETGNDVRVDYDGLVQINEIPSGRPAFFVAKGNYLVVLFPELVPEEFVKIRQTTDGAFYRGKVSYAGNRQMILKLGADLKK
jgi:hypothetical protein